MKITLLFTCLALNTLFVMAQQEAFHEQTPSEVYYEENISSQSRLPGNPSLRSGDDDLDPGGSGTGQGGFVGAPIGKASSPIIAGAVIYFAFISYKNRNSKKNKPK